jgi:hypothetical protein
VLIVLPEILTSRTSVETACARALHALSSVHPPKECQGQYEDLVHELSRLRSRLQSDHLAC